MSEAIRCIGSVYKVQTLVDHGVRITIDLPETAIMQAAMFMECQRMAVALSIEATPIEANSTNPDTADGKKTRSETKSLRGN
jgi:chemotaxis protein histidine kinase CheA